MDYEAISGELSKVFKDKGYTWKVDGVLTVPSQQDILETLEEMVRQLEHVPSGTWMELGHLILIKTGRFIDVYMHHGTVERQDEQPNEEPVL
jgi:hypothetical protein